MKKNGGKTYNEIPNRTRCRDTLNKRIINPFFSLYTKRGKRIVGIAMAECISIARSMSLFNLLIALNGLQRIW